MNTQQYGNDVLGKLTDALVQDIMSTPADVLLSEVAEDHGSADVLSAEFDRIIAPMVREFCRGSLDACQESRAASDRRPNSDGPIPLAFWPGGVNRSSHTQFPSNRLTLATRLLSDSAASRDRTGANAPHRALLKRVAAAQQMTGHLRLTPSMRDQHARFDRCRTHSGLSSAGAAPWLQSLAEIRRSRGS